MTSIGILQILLFFALILACTKPRRFPGVRWVMLKIENKSLLNFTTIPGRNCVAESMKLLYLSECELTV